MHELSLAVSLVDGLLEAAAREGAARVVRIELRVGRFGGVDPEALAFAFPIAAEGTIAAGAQLAITEAPLVVDCRACGARTEPEYPNARCAACASGDIAVVSGEELQVVAMEVTDVP